ncbi:hypothetical protein [Streptomyces sp. NPDC054765]
MGEDLKPCLKGWSPYGLDERYWDGAYERRDLVFIPNLVFTPS